jgi:DNA primase
MEMDKVSFPEAIEQLAKKTGVELVYENSGKGFSAEDEAKKKAKEELFELYRRVSGTFQHFLLEKREAGAAKHYIIKRGINIDMIDRFGLGYSPSDRHWLHKFLSGKGYSDEFLASSGLFSSRHPNTSFFSGRLMFPIADRQGRVVAFGGRFLEQSANPEWESPKYINSPESGIYKKRDTLYAIDLALPEIKKTKTAYITEGYIDVIALHQAGICNALAPLGTAFTDEQAKLLKRWAEKIIFFFDSDEAGLAAAIKGIYACRKNALACSLVTPDSEAKDPAAPTDLLELRDQLAPKDPADILLRYGPEALKKKAGQFLGDFEYLLLRARSFSDKSQAIAFLFPYMKLLDSEVARNSCIELAADSFGLLPSAVAEDYRRYASGRTPEITIPAGAGELKRDSEIKSPVHRTAELSLLAAVAINYVSSGEEKLFPKFRIALEISDIEDPNARELFIALEECARYEETGMDELLARIPSPELQKFLIERSATGEFSMNPTQFVFDGIKKIREKRFERRQKEIIVKLRSMKSNAEDARELLAEKILIDDELFKLRQG